MLSRVLFSAASPVRAAVLLCAGLALGPARQDLLGQDSLTRAEDRSSAGEVFVELAPVRAQVLLAEPFELVLRIGVERGFRSERLVQLFQRPLDLPVQVFAPALEALDGLRYLDGLERAEGLTFALDERITRALPAGELEREGRVFALFELRRRAVALHPGDLALGAPTLAYAHATRFEDDFLRGRLAVDRQDAFVRGAPARLAVAPPPAEGRPDDFSGAVGSFSISAAAEPQDLRLGESLALVVVIQADAAGGDLSEATEPRLEPPPGLHLLGTLPERTSARLSVRYALEPRADGAFELPSVRFTYFCPEPPAGYRTLVSEPIPIVVRESLEAPAPAEERAPAPQAHELPDGRLRPLALLAPGILLLLLFLALVRRARGGKS